MDVDLELSNDTSIVHDRSIEDLFALASDASESDAIDVDEALFNLDSDFGSSRILNDFDEDEGNDASPTFNRRIPGIFAAEKNSAVSTSSEEDRFVESIERQNAHSRTGPMTITLSSDDELDSHPDRPSTSRAEERARLPNSRSTRYAKAAAVKHTKAPVPAKKQRNSPSSRQVQKNRRATSATVSSAPLESSLRRREDEFDVEMVSNSVGDITLGRIQQLEADELLARELQSVYDNEDDHRRRTHRSRPSAFVPPRRVNRHVRTATASSPHVINQTREIINQNRGATLSTGMTDNDGQNRWTRRSARPAINRADDRRRDHATSSLFFFDRDDDDDISSRALLSGPIRIGDMVFRNAELAAGSMFNVRNIRHPVPADVAAFINWNTDDRVDSFEEVLEMAERVGDANVGLKSTEIAAFTTSKVYSASSYTENEKEVCSVCMSDYETGDALLVLPCIHNFHKSCISRWLTNKPTCPICRIDVRS